MFGKGPYYKATITYTAVLVTTILILLAYRVFIAAPSNEIKCTFKPSALEVLSHVLA